MQENVIPTNGMIVSEDTQFASGVYVLPGGISIAADGVTLVGNDTLILSGMHSGSGIHVTGKRAVAIKDLHISGFYHGVCCDDCEGITIDNVRMRDTWEIAGIDTFLYLWLPVEQVYGGGLLFNRVQNGTVINCDLQHQLNGILLYDCTGITVADNNASFNSGWGVYLSGTHNSIISDNRLDFCNRMFRRPETGAMRAEADAAGIVMVKGASRNRILRNSCVGGGDGIFVAGYEHPGKNTPCNDNVFEDNDCRLSPNNAIESTFSRGNIFRRNNCSQSNYGFWMGYSWENTLEDNIVEQNRHVGIAIEHGHDFTIRHNQVRHNDEGVRLWTRGGAVVPYWPGHEVSYNFTLEDNLIEHNGTGFAGYTGEETVNQLCHDYELKRNQFVNNRVGASFARVATCHVEENTFVGNVVGAVRLIGEPDVTLSANIMRDNVVDVLRE